MSDCVGRFGRVPVAAFYPLPALVQIETLHDLTTCARRFGIDC